MNDKAKPELPSETFPHALAGYLTRNGQVGNLPDMRREIEDFMRDAMPESDTRGEVTLPALDDLFSQIVTPASDDEWSQGDTNTGAELFWKLHWAYKGDYRTILLRMCRRYVTLGRHLLSTLHAKNAAESSNLLLREENERLRAAKDDAIYFQDRVKEIGFADTDEVKHAKEDLARMREDLATLRASASSETLADAYERGQLLMRDKCAAFYDSRAGDIGIQRYLRPTATNPEKADRSQG